MKKIILFIIFVFIVSGLWSDLTNDCLTTQLKKELLKKDEVEFIRINIRLEKQYNTTQLIEDAKKFDKNERRKYVIRELTTFSHETQTDILDFLKQNSNSVKDIKPLWVTNVISCKATKGIINQLAERDDINRIDYDEFRKMITTKQEDKSKNNEKEITWNITRVNADDVWSLGYDGNGVLVSVLDTGLNYNHTDISDHLWDGGTTYPNHGYDFVNDDNDPWDEGGDANGHGTHCAGTVAGDGTSGSQTGIAPNADIMALKVLSGDGSGTESGVWNAIQFSIDNDVDVMSMSIGWQHSWGVDRESWRNSMNSALAAGVVAAVASGNEWDNVGDYPVPDNVRTPGDCPPPWLNPDQTIGSSVSASITVGASNTSDNSAYFSSRGPCDWSAISPWNDYPYDPGIGLIRPDLSAPGTDIKSLDYSSNTGYASGWQGTSMATPCVAGVIALMLNKNNALTPEQISQIIEENVQTAQEPKNNSLGNGIVDALQAVNAVSSSGNPMCSITSPENNANILLGEDVQITATASDPAKSVNRVEFYIDGGATPDHTDYTSPYEYLWNTTAETEGSHTIKAVVFDDEANEGEDQINVNLVTPQSLPFTEDFSTPANWSQQRVGCTDRWTLNSSSNAGGSTPEMQAVWENVDPATTRYISPMLNTSGLTELELSFKHFFDDYSGSGVTIKIQSSTDKTSWTDESWSYSDGSSSINLGPETINTTINNNLGSITYIAWVIEGNLYNFDYWYFDDVNVTAAYPSFSMNPGSLNFGDVEINTSSTLQFTLTNSGSAAMTGEINAPSGYTVSESAKRESIGKNILSYSIPAASDKDFDLEFQPISEQNYDNNLVITSNDPVNPSNNLALYGSGIAAHIDALPNSFSQMIEPDSTAADTLVITNSGDVNLNYTANLYTVLKAKETLINEDFSSTFPPTDWTITGGTNWQSHDDNLAGGTAPEAEFNWSPSNDGVQRLISKTVNTSGINEIELEFKHYINHYASGASNYELRLETSSDGSLWNTIATFPPANQAATTENITISNSDVGSATFRIAFVFDGDSFDINYWDIDDVLLTYTAPPSWVTLNSLSSISGTITPGSSENIDVDFDASELSEGIYNANIVINSNDPDSSTITFPITMTVQAIPKISINPDSLAFGNTFVNSYIGQSFTIYNTGSDTLNGEVSTITDYWVVDPASALTKKDNNKENSLTFEIFPGQDKELEIYFYPQTNGAFNGNVSISSNDPMQSLIYLKVTGQGIYPADINCETDSINFGEVVLGNYVIEQFTLENTGDDTLSGTINTFDGYWIAEAAETVTSRPGNNKRNSLNFDILGTEQQIFDLYFYPDSTGISSGNISITSNDDDESPLYISVTGTGIHMPPVNVTITQVTQGMKLSWQQNEHVETFLIYAAEKPDGTYELIGSTPGNSFIDQNSDNYEERFYYIKAE